MQCVGAKQVTPEKRAQAKQMAYGLLYGMGKHALARSMGVPPDTAQQLSDSFRASIPDLVCQNRPCAALFLAPWYRCRKSPRQTLTRLLACMHSIQPKCTADYRGAHASHHSQQHWQQPRTQAGRSSMAVQDKWMRGLVEACRRDRFVTTIGGRRRYLIDIDSTDSSRRAAAERQAINSAVQVAQLAFNDCVSVWFADALSQRNLYAVA